MILHTHPPASPHDAFLIDQPPPATAAQATTLRPTATLTRSGPPAARRLHSAELFEGEQQIEIEHGDAVYRLRRTALGKLILTK